MLELAIKAGLPLITVRTDDLLNVKEVLSFISTNPVLELTNTNPGTDKVYYTSKAHEAGVWEKLYATLTERDSVLVVINPDDPVPGAFNSGVMPTPPALIKKHLSSILHEEEVDPLMRCLSGLTLKQVVELIRLTQVQHGNLQPKNVLSMRVRLMGGMQGLNQVEVRDELYVPQKDLAVWVDKNRKYFLEASDERLIPRGVLLNGPPGTGKTMGAKFLARQLDVPLYRLDLSSSLGKYVGESESNLAKVLATVDQEEPCVMLIDEVEKLFREKDDSGVTSRLLSQLLWWLQEHRSRVLTVMTTNNLILLPPELHRAGRIDQRITISELEYGDAKELARKILAQFIQKPTVEMRNIVASKVIEAMVGGTIPHATVNAIVIDTIKQHDWV